MHPIARNLTDRVWEACMNAHADVAREIDERTAFARSPVGKSQGAVEPDSDSHPADDTIMRILDLVRELNPSL